MGAQSNAPRVASYDLQGARRDRSQAIAPAPQGVREPQTGDVSNFNSMYVYWHSKTKTQCARESA
jgi:hypothetical protein